MLLRIAADAPTEVTSAMDRLADLDLSMIRMKLADPEEGRGWSEDQLDLAESEYRKFLALCLAYPDAEIVPCTLVDEMWHAHILDTIAYRQDCQRIFGFFYDHFPYFGMRGDDDAQALWTAYDDTMTRYIAAFGQPPDDTWRPSSHSKCSRTNCKPQRCR